MNKLGKIWRYYYFGLYIPGYILKEIGSKIIWKFKQKKYDIGIKLIGEDLPANKICFFATYPEENFAYKKSLEYILESLSQTSYHIVIVCNRAPNKNLLSLFSRFNCTVYLRKNKGRDFAAYQAAYLQYLEKGYLHNTQNCLFINDTLIWLTTATEIISQVEKYTWGTLFLNLEKHSHAQSFFLHFNHEILNSPEFKKFWREYLPLNSKRHLIHRGEIALTSNLLASGYIIESLIDPTYIRDVIANNYDHPELQSIGLGGIRPSGQVPRRNSRFAEDSFIDLISNSFSNSSFLTQSAETFQRLEFVNWLINNVYSDPPHRIGLHLTFAVKFPLKKDIYKFQTLGNIELALSAIESSFRESILNGMSAQMQNYMRGDIVTRYKRKLGEK